MIETTAGPDPWQHRHVDPHACGASFGRMVDAVRRLQDAVALMNAPEESVASAAEDIERLASSLEQWQVSEWDRCAGRRHDLPGRGHPLLVPLVVEESTASVVRGSVVFSSYYLGGNGAVHGGAVPLLFDEVLGMLANASSGPPPARTAYLTVNYRAITPVGVPLRLDATVDRTEGRKTWVTGRLTDGERLVSEAEGLFVRLRPGMP